MRCSGGCLVRAARACLDNIITAIAEVDWGKYRALVSLCIAMGFVDRFSLPVGGAAGTPIVLAKQTAAIRALRAVDRLCVVVDKKPCTPIFLYGGAIDDDWHQGRGRVEQRLQELERGLVVLPGEQS